MLSFESDYTTGAHPRILERLLQTNLESLPGYGSDHYCERAKEKIRQACHAPNADVWFLSGGTQTNAVVIASLLQSFEGVIAAETGHVSVHEAGAIEYTGHKVLTLHAGSGRQTAPDGKIRAEDLEQYLAGFYQDQNHDHMVFPGMVYISHPTEYGALYTKKELGRLSGLCRAYGIPLYLDGARLIYGLMSGQTDVTLADIARYCDVFYIGGTKAGALCGEAVVFTGKRRPAHFLTVVKQHGALLAKGRLLGVQFDALFTDDLYETIGRHAIAMAEQLRQVFHRKQYSFYYETPTNQQFLILENDRMEELKQNVAFSFWEKADETHTVVRFATSWSTTEADIRALEELL